MVIKYNTLNRVEPPMLTLCNPGCEKQDYVPRLTRAIGVLQDCEAIELVLNFNSPSELNFRINQVDHTEIEDITERHHVENLYQEVQNRRVIFAEMVGANLTERPRDEVGFFQITNVEIGYEGGRHYKDVTAQSIEVEFQQWTIPYIENGTYYFCEPEVRQDDIPSILNMIVDRVPLWTIDHIDSSLQGGAGQPILRTFEDVDTETDCLTFMLENLQETYDCIILFDPIRRTVNAYDKTNYVKQTDIHITTDDVISGAKVTDNAGDLCTALSVRSSEDVGISAVNPLGGNTIYDFSYYKPWMSPELAAQVTQWEYDIEHANFSGTPFMNEVHSYYRAAWFVSNYEMEIDRLTNLKTQYERCRDNIVAAGNATLAESNKAITSYGGTPVTMQSTIPATVAAINQLISDVETQLEDVYIYHSEDDPGYTSAKSTMDTCDAEIRDIQDRLTPEHYFRPNLLTYIPQFDDGNPAFNESKATKLDAGEAYEWSFDSIGSAASWRLTAAFFRDDDNHTRISSGVNGFFPKMTYSTTREEFTTGVVSSKSLVFTPSEDCYVMLGYYDGGSAGQGTNAMKNPRLCKRTNGVFDELVHYIYQGDYVDEYTVITDEMDSEQRLEQILLLLDKGKKELGKVSTPSEEFDVDVESVLFSEKFQHWDTQLETGCLINVDLVDSPNMIADAPKYTDSLVELDTYRAARLQEGTRYIFTFEGITDATKWVLTAAFFELDGTRITNPTDFSFSPSVFVDSTRGVFYTGTMTRRYSWMFTAPKDCYVMFGFRGGDTTASAQVINPYLRKADGDVSALFLSTITVNYDDCNLNLTFGNKYNKFDPKSLFDKVLGNVTKTATDLSFVKSAITNIRYGQYDAMREAIEDSRNITMRGALVAENQQFVLDESGFTGRTYNEDTGEYSKAQIKITAENIVFTRDGWDHAATAIGHLDWRGEDVYGVNAEVLIGNLIIGQSLILSNNDNTMTFNENGLTMTGGYFQIKFNPGDANALMTIKELAHGTQSERMLLGISNGTFAINNEVVRVAWNGYSQSIQLSQIGGYAGLNIYDGTTSASDPTQNLMMSMQSTGAWYYKDGNRIGKIGTNHWEAYPNERGLVFDLENGVSYMAWDYRVNSTDNVYTAKLVYCPNGLYDSSNNTIVKPGFTFSDKVYMDDVLYLTQNLRTRSFSGGSAALHLDGNYTFYLWSGHGFISASSQTADHTFIMAYNTVSGETRTPHSLVDLYRVSNSERYFGFVDSVNNVYTAKVRLETGDISTTGKVTASNISSNSDERLKTNIVASDINALDILNRIDVKSFDWIESGDHEDAGIVAQDLQQIVPSAVTEDPETTVLSVDRTKLVPYIIKAIQEISEQIGISKSDESKTKRSVAKGAGMTEEQKRDFIASLNALRVVDIPEKDGYGPEAEKIALPQMMPSAVPEEEKEKKK